MLQNLPFHGLPISRFLTVSFCQKILLHSGAYLTNDFVLNLGREECILFILEERTNCYFVLEEISDPSASRLSIITSQNIEIFRILLAFF